MVVHGDRKFKSRGEALARQPGTSPQIFSTATKDLVLWKRLQQTKDLISKSRFRRKGLKYRSHIYIPFNMAMRKLLESFQPAWRKL